MAQPQAINLVQAALRSDRDFETYKPQIINKIKASDDVFIRATVDTVKKYLKDKKKEGFSKLTALMLLKECMDTKNAAMVEYVHKKILRRLGLIAQGKDKCLPKDTSDALVKLFSQLLRECIVVWNDWFGYDKKKNPTKYKKTYDSVFAKVEKPTKLVHFTKPEAAEERVLPQSINQSEVKSGSRTPYQDLSARPGASDSVVVETQQQEPPKKKFEIKPQQDPFIEKMNALMKHIKGNKEMMYEQMAISEEPDQQGVKMILQNLIKANQQLADNWDELEAKEFDTKEAMIDQAIIDNETIEELVNEYNRMMKKEITMEDYRLFVIKTLSDPTKSGGFEAPAAVQASRKVSEVEPGSVKVSKGQVSSPMEQRSVATPAQVQAQSQSQSQSQQRPQQNDGFDLDAFEEASPGIQASKQQAAVDQERERAARLAQEKAERDEFINGPPTRDQRDQGPPARDQGQPRPPATKAVAAGSEASEGGTRKAPRNFRDLFNNDNQARGRKAGVGSKRDKSNLDDSKGSVGFGKSWDINPQGGVQTRTRNQQQQNNKAQGGGLGVDDFEDLPEPSGTYVDTSNMSSDSRTYDFNYDQSRAHGMNKSKSRLDPRDTRDNYNSQQRFSPSGNVLPPNDEYNIRGTRKVSPNPSPGYERASARQQHDWEPEEKYATNQNQNVNSNYNNNPAPAPAKKNLAVDTQAANRKYEQEQQIKVQFNNRPSDGGNHGFGNPFGQADDENNNGNQSAGFPNQNTFQESKPSIKVNGVQQQQQQEAARRNNPQAQSQAQVQPQRSTNQQQPAAGLNNISVTQSVIAPTATGQNPRFAPIERPGFLNSLGTTQTINISTYDGPAMRQADELLDRARRLTSNSRPPSHLDTRPNLRTSVAGLDYQPIPPLFSTTAPIDLGGVRPSMATAPLDQMRRSSLERVGPYVSATFNSTLPGPMVNSAVLNQSMSSAAVGDGFLREIERAREQSKAIAAKYSSPGSRRQSDALLSANLLPAAALLQGPTKYTNGESTVNSAVKIESHDLRQSYLQQQQQSKPAKVEEIERTSYRDYNNGGKTAATGYISERSEKLSRGYNTAKFPEAGEGKEMSRAAQLIEKARRLRDESKQRKTFAGEDSDKKEYLYKTPKSEFRNSEVNNLKESAYLVDRERERDVRANDRYRDASVDRNLRTSQVETRYRAEDHLSHAAPQTFYNRYETRPQTQPQEFDNIAAVNIRSRDIPRGREPVRLMGPDGTVYEEVRQGYGIGRKPTPTPGPRDRERDSPLTVGDVRGRSKETRHETLGQLRHQEYASNMRESRAVDMKRSAYHEAKELLEASRRDVSYERRGRFENNFSMATPDRNVQRNSPLKARQEQVQEAVELKVGESLRIVERPVPGNYGRSISRSPAPAGRGSVNSLKASLNVIPDNKIQQAKPSSSQSQKLANDIKSQLNDLKRSLMGRKEKSESATSKATLQLDGSSNSVPQIGLVQQQYQHRPIVVQHEEVKIRDEEPRKLGVRVDSREIMGAYGSRIAERELKRSGVVENRTAAIVSPVRNEVVGVRLERKESETTPAITPYGTDEGFSRRLNVKEISGVQGVKLTMDDSNVWEEESTLRTRGGMEEDSLRRERETLYRELVGPSYNKPKMGRAVHFDYYLFDQITNAVFANGQGKDVDVFKGACLQKKAVLFDSAKLKIDVITRMEDEDGRSGNKLKVILHYANKSNQSITAFNVDIVENSIEQNPRINGNNLPPKYQLKQELYLDFSNFKNLCYTLQISYQHEGFPYSAKVPLPLSVNKYMKMKTVSTGEYKKQWKNLKPGSVKSKYKHINAKFIRDHTEVNKYFDNCLVDVTPTLNPKRKRKYGGVFVLPDGSEHYLRVVLDHSRIKFVVCSARGSQYADWAVQYLSYLLTV